MSDRPPPPTAPLDALSAEERQTLTQLVRMVKSGELESILIENHEKTGRLAVTWSKHGGGFLCH
jgi:hypothetical protein